MRVKRTFAFLDLCGFTAFTDHHGDAEAVAVLAHLRGVTRMHAETYGVRVTKWLGDGAMLSGVEGTSVVRCAQAVCDEIQRDGSLALRGGLSSGEVIMFEGDDYIGVAVNLAARLCRAARPGELLINEELRPSVPEGLQATTAEPTDIAGMKRPVTPLAIGRATR
jgi:adenylate cyclase